MKAKRPSEVTLRQLNKGLEPEMALEQTTSDESIAVLVTHPAGTLCNPTPRLHSAPYPLLTRGVQRVFVPDTWFTVRTGDKVYKTAPPLMARQFGANAN
jgi:hypothetical protein